MNVLESQPKLYTEIIVVTIVSLVAASFWIEWSKGMVNYCFSNNSTAMLACALVVTLIAILGLQVVFNETQSHSQTNHHGKVT